MRWLFTLFLSSISLFALAEETTLLLIRHGETDWNKKWLVQGQTDIPLNDTGLNQASKVAEILYKAHPDVSAIYSSDLIRAVQTANESSIKYDLPIITSQALREIKCGISEGMKIKDKYEKYGPFYKAIKEKYPNRKERWDQRCIEGEETFNELLQRVREKLIELALKHSGKKIAVFSHSKSIGVLLADLLDLENPKKVENCSVIELIYDTDKRVFYYDMSH